MMPMNNTCFNTSTIRNCGLSVPEEIELVAKAGFGGIELWVSEIETYIEAGGTLAELRNMLEQNQLKVPNLIAFFEWAHPSAEKRATAYDEATHIFEMAQALNCPYVAAPPFGVADRTDIPLRDIATYYQALLRATEASPVMPLLEFWGHSTTLGSFKEALAVVRMLDNPDVILLADVFHMAKAGDDPAQLEQLTGKQLGLFHLNDYPDAPDVSKLTDAERVYPGDGIADLSLIFAILNRIEYQGMLSLELFNERYEQAGAKQVVETGMAKMKAVLAS
ncbi:MAG: sugar phosphate isomerase/epimerase family protein [Chloroflexota bacterium]